MYNSLVERCFRDCVETFRRKDLEPAEEKVRRKGEDRIRIDGVWVLGASPSLQRAHARTRTPSHTQCVQKCCEKYMKHSSRVGVRFAELSSQVRKERWGVDDGMDGWMVRFVRSDFPTTLSPLSLSLSRNRPRRKWRR